MREPTDLMKLRARQIQRYYFTKPRTTYRRMISYIDLKRARLLQPTYKLKDCSPGEVEYPPQWETMPEALARFLARPSWVSLPVTENKTSVSMTGNMRTPAEPAVESTSPTKSKTVGKNSHPLNQSSTATFTKVEDMDIYTKYINNLANLGADNLDSGEDNAASPFISFSGAHLAPSEVDKVSDFLAQGDPTSAIPHQTSLTGIKRPLSMILDPGQEALVSGIGWGLPPPAQRRRLSTITVPARLAIMESTSSFKVEDCEDPDGNYQEDQVLPSIEDEPCFSSDPNHEHVTPCSSDHHSPSSLSSVRQTHNSEDEDTDGNGHDKATHAVVAKQTEQLSKGPCDPSIECNPSTKEECPDSSLPIRSSNPEDPEARGGIIQFLKSTIASGFSFKNPTLPPTPNANPSAIRHNGYSQGNKFDLKGIEPTPGGPLLQSAVPEAYAKTKVPSTQFEDPKEEGD